LERDGITDEAAWSLWSTSKDEKSQALTLRRRYTQQLQGALVHDPALEQAHRALAELRLGELVQATATGDHRAKERLNQQFARNLEHLSPRESQALEGRLDELLTDTIAGQRSRRGVLVGRQTQRAAIGKQIEDDSRLVTLVGTAGVGKTRLALEIADDLRTATERAIFCDLTEATDALGIARLVSRAMDVRLRDNAPLEHLAELLGKQTTLLVMDNLEQVLGAAGAICERWIEQVPNLRIIATSRAKLNIEAEQVVSLKPMTLLESMELFARRGEDVHSGFVMSAENREQIGDLVQQLDGLPLAIELAAARLNIMSLHEIVNHLGERFSLLRSRGRDAQALQGALDWSWDLLKPWSKAALSQVSVFRGGFNLSAAESVVAFGNWKNCPAMFDVLGELAENSLLRRDLSDDGTVRYGLLESIRAYATDKLETQEAVAQGLSGSQADKAVRLRHAKHFSRFGKTRYLAGLDSFESAKHWTALFQELDNLVAAIGHGDEQSAPRCCMAALKILGMKGPVSLGVDIATQALNIPNIPQRLQMQIELERSKCLRISGRMNEARELVREQVLQSGLLESGGLPEEPEATPLTLEEPLTDTATNASSDRREDTAELDANSLEGQRLVDLANIELQQGKYPSAEHYFRQALSLFQETDDHKRMADTLENIGIIKIRIGEFKQSEKLMRQALGVYRDLGNKRSESLALGNIGTLYIEQGQFEHALTLFEQALTINEQLEDRHLQAHNLANIGAVHYARGALEQAEASYRQALIQAQEIGSVKLEAGCLENLGLVALIGDELEAASKHCVNALTLYKKMNDTRGEANILGTLGEVLSKQGRLDEAAKQYRASIQLGDETAPVAAGYFRSALARLLAHQEQFEEAHRLLESGEEQVASHPHEHAKLLCQKAHVHLLATDFDQALLSLQRAQEIVAKLEHNEHWEVAKAIAEVAQLLGVSPVPEQTHHKTTGEEETAELGPILLEGQRLLELGHIEREQSNTDAAMECFNKALALFQQVAYRKGESEAAGGIGNVYQHLGEYPQAIAYYQQALTTAREVGDRHNEGIQLGNIGVVYQNLGDTQKAIEHYRNAIQIHREIGNRRREGIYLGNLGNLYQDVGDYPAAIEHFEQTISIARDIGNKRSEGSALGNLANTYQRLGEYSKAIEHYQQAIQIHRDIGNLRNEGIHLGSLGIVCQKLGDLPTALEHFTQAIRIAREIGNRRSEGIHLGNLGDLHLEQHRFDDAESALRQAISIGDETFKLTAGAFRGSLALLLAQKDQLDEAQALLTTGEPQVEPYPEEHALFLCKKAQVQLFGGQVDDAHASLNKAQALAEKLGVNQHSAIATAIAETAGRLGIAPIEEALETDEIDPTILAGERLIELGTIERNQANYEEAERCYREAIAIFESANHRSGECEGLGQLGNIYLTLGQFQAAKKQYQESIRIAKEAGYRHQEARLCGNLGGVFTEQGAYREAAEHYESAIEIAREIGNKRLEGSLLGNLGLVMESEGALTEAATLLERALAISREIGHKLSEGISLANLGSVAREQGRLEEATERYKQAITIARAIGEKRHEGAMTGNLGLVRLAQGRLEEASALLLEAIDIARLVGNTGSEGINRGNLGDVYARLQRRDEAQAAYQEAIAICQETFPPGASDFRASLALLLAQEERMEEALALLEAGEQQERSPPSLVARFLCKKAQVLLIAGQRDAALTSLEQAKTLAAEIGVHEHSELAKSISETAGQLGLAPVTEADDDLGEPEETEDLDAAVLEGLRWLELGTIEREQSNFPEAKKCFRKALALFRQLEHPKGEAEAMGGLGNICQQLGDHPEAIEHFQQAIALSRQSGDHGYERILVGNLGIVYQHLGDYPRAIEHFQQALAFARIVGDQRSEGNKLGSLALVYQHLGDYPKAIEHFQQALAFTRIVGDQRSEGNQLGNLGLLYQNLGDIPKAMEHYKLALHIARARDDKRAESGNLGNLGLVYQDLGDIPTAIEKTLQALSIARKIGDKRNAGIHVGNLGELFLDDGQLDEAEAAFREGISVCDTSLPPAAGAFRGSLGLLLAKQGQINEARDLLTTGEPQVAPMPDEHGKFLCKKAQVLLIAGEPEAAMVSHDQAREVWAHLGLNERSDLGRALKELGLALKPEERSSEEGTEELIGKPGPAEEDEEGPEVTDEVDLSVLEAQRLTILGNIEVDQANYPEAERCFERALALFQQQEHRAGESEVYGLMGTLSRLQGATEQAEEYFHRALPLARKSGHQRAEFKALSGLANLCRQRQDFDGSVTLYAQALTLAREVEDKANEGTAIGNLALVYRQQGRLELAIERYQEALSLQRTVGHKSNEGTLLGNLGSIYRLQGNYELAIEHYQQALDISREVGDPRVQSAALGNLALALRQQGQFQLAVDYDRQSLALRREIGDRRNEGLALGNLGDSLFELKELEEAEASYREAIALSEVHSPVAAGIFQGSLALLLAQQHHLSEAQALLETAEPKVAVHPEEHTTFLCKKARIQLLGGDQPGATATLKQARALIAKLNLNEHSTLSKAIDAVEDTMDKPSKAHPSSFDIGPSGAQ
jgi:tetratricopeptide (TPR) repeat protein